MRCCVVGAGASGLAAAKNLKAQGIPFDVIEREDDVGGNWYYGKPHSSVYQSTHLISSKPMSAYLDFPMPADYPDYPNHAQVLAYLRAYARHFDLYPHIQFNTTLERVERTPDGLWDARLSGPTGTETRRYDALLIANGHHWDPKWPSYPGVFDGPILHSAHYKTPDILRGKRVLVVGAGNSGCDIAVEAVHHAARVYLSMRRGYHFLPKYILGRPTDQVNELMLKLRLPVLARRPLNRLMLHILRGDPTRFGLPKPDHRLLEAHPIVNSQLIYFLGHGDITPLPDIQELRGSTVRFVNGREEAIDLIVYATGFKLSFPFIDREHLNWPPGSDGPRLYLHVFHPRYDNLFVAGLIQPDSGQFWIVDYQCRLIAHFLRAQRDNPAQAEAFRRRKAGPQPNLRGGIRHLGTPRHYLEVEHSSYARQLRRLIRSFAP